MKPTGSEIGGDTAGEKNWESTLSLAGFWEPQSTETASGPEAKVPHFVQGLTDDERRNRNIFVSLLVGDQKVKGNLASACMWYIRWLEFKFYTRWQLFCRVLNGLEDDSNYPGPGDLTVVYGFVISVLHLFKDKKELALVDIVDNLDNEGLLKQQTPDEERAAPNKLVFATLGWISMLYTPVSYSDEATLEVDRFSISCSGCRTNLTTKCYRTFKQTFDYVDSPLYSLFSRFGSLIPEAKQHQAQSPGLRISQLHEVIKVQSICFRVLQSTGVYVEWVDNLALHLEFDRTTRTLKLFRFPSFCRMMYIEQQENILSRLFEDYGERNFEGVKSPTVEVRELFREILLTFSLIFGQDKESSEAFTCMRRASEDQLNQHAWDQTWDCDPLLSILCENSMNSGEARAVYADVDITEPTGYYDPNIDLQLFGRRLIELQQFTEQHRPSEVNALQSDGHDLSAWYPLRNKKVLIIFATSIIFLLILTLAFQVWQVILARQQIQSFSP